jgi:hypothetical protein
MDGRVMTLADRSAITHPAGERSVERSMRMVEADGRVE